MPERDLLNATPNPALLSQSHPSWSRRDWSRLDGVDLLRALAIVYVLMNHVNMRLIFTNLHYLRGVPRQLASSLVWQGQSGVQIFFAVSGFLITATSIRRWGGPTGNLSQISLRAFYILRFARIAPLLLALLALLSLLHALQVEHFVVSPQQGGLKAALIAALTFRVGLLEATKGYLPGNWDILWSLSVEEAFYLFFPLACRFLKGKWLILLLLSFVILGPFGRTILSHGNETWQEYSYLGGMDAIALGCLTALALNSTSRTHSRTGLSRRTVLALTITGSSLLVFCLCFSLQLDKLGLEKAGLVMTLIAIGTCLLIAASAQSHWQAPKILAPVLAYGRRSYEIYLTHMFLVFACFDYFMTTSRSLKAIPLLFLITIFLAGILGELVGRFYSEPANRWLRSQNSALVRESS